MVTLVSLYIVSPKVMELTKDVKGGLTVLPSTQSFGYPDAPI